MTATQGREHEAIIDPDARGRFNLRKFLGHHPGARYRVFVSDDRTSLTLERVETEET